MGDAEDMFSLSGPSLKIERGEEVADIQMGFFWPVVQVSICTKACWETEG